jgi:hypothetical protein
MEDDLRMRLFLCSLDVIVTDVILGCDCDKRDGVPGGDQHQYRGEENHRAQSTAPATSGMLSLSTLHSVLGIRIRRIRTSHKCLERTEILLEKIEI